MHSLKLVPNNGDAGLDQLAQATSHVQTNPQRDRDPEASTYGRAEIADNESYPVAAHVMTEALVVSYARDSGPGPILRLETAVSRRSSCSFARVSSQSRSFGIRSFVLLYRIGGWTHWNFRSPESIAGMVALPLIMGRTGTP